MVYTDSPAQNEWQHCLERYSFPAISTLRAQAAPLLIGRRRPPTHLAIRPPLAPLHVPIGRRGLGAGGGALAEAGAEGALGSVSGLERSILAAAATAAAPGQVTFTNTVSFFRHHHHHDHHHQHFLPPPELFKFCKDRLSSGMPGGITFLTSQSLEPAQAKVDLGSLIAGDDCQLLSLHSHRHMPRHWRLESLTTDQHLRGMNN
nr:PREDICTED: SKI family transcriptional corepressor 2-like [Equus przewalskii]